MSGSRKFLTTCSVAALVVVNLDGTALSQTRLPDIEVVAPPQTTHAPRKPKTRAASARHNTTPVVSQQSATEPATTPQTEAI